MPPSYLAIGSSDPFSGHTHNTYTPHGNRRYRSVLQDDENVVEFLFSLAVGEGGGVREEGGVRLVFGLTNTGTPALLLPSAAILALLPLTSIAPAIHKTSEFLALSPSRLFTHRGALRDRFRMSRQRRASLLSAKHRPQSGGEIAGSLVSMAAYENARVLLPLLAPPSSRVALSLPYSLRRALPQTLYPGIQGILVITTNRFSPIAERDQRVDWLLEVAWGVVRVGGEEEDDTDWGVEGVEQISALEWLSEKERPRKKFTSGAVTIIPGAESDPAQFAPHLLRALSSLPPGPRLIITHDEDLLKKALSEASVDREFDVGAWKSIGEALGWDERVNPFDANWGRAGEVSPWPESRPSSVPSNMWDASMSPGPSRSFGTASGSDSRYASTSAEPRRGATNSRFKLEDADQKHVKIESMKEETLDRGSTSEQSRSVTSESVDERRSSIGSSRVKSESSEIRVKEEPREYNLNSTPSATSEVQTKKGGALDTVKLEALDDECRRLENGRQSSEFRGLSEGRYSSDPDNRIRSRSNISASSGSGGYDPYGDFTRENEEPLFRPNSRTPSVRTSFEDERDHHARPRSRSPGPSRNLLRARELYERSGFCDTPRELVADRETSPTYVLSTLSLDRARTRIWATPRNQTPTIRSVARELGVLDSTNTITYSALNNEVKKMCAGEEVQLLWEIVKKLVGGPEQPETDTWVKDMREKREIDVKRNVAAREREAEGGSLLGRANQTGLQPQPMARGPNGGLQAGMRTAGIVGLDTDEDEDDY